MSQNILKKIAWRITSLIIILLWAIVFYFQFERPYIARFTQNISPLLLFSTLPNAVFFTVWISAPLLALSIIKGRIFCWKACPVGMLQDIIPSVGKTKHSKINLYIFLSSLAILFFGTNLLACFDPFVTFNRLIILFKIKIEAAFIFTIPFILIIILNLYKKRLWCFKLCPLGAFFDWIALLKNKQVVDLNKRKTIIALGSGLILGTLSKGIKPLASSADKQLLRPPGSLPENEFVDRCIRCGSCLGVCLTGTLTPSFFEAGLNGLFTPKLDPIKAECDEYCNKCGTACPTQAIKAMSLEIKRNFKIGTAEINRTKCIAWSENQLCLVCQEFCPYLAITSVKNQNGIPSPAVIDNLCRGCGHCENHCPARPTRAIKIYSTGSGTFIK